MTTMLTYEPLQTFLTVLGVLFALYSVYYGVIAAFGFKKRREAPAAPARTRFAVLVAARNEEAVIGNLVDSLLAQNYPRALYDVYVAPNNCTDNTRGVALAHGAKIFTPKGTIRSKGEVLAQAADRLLEEGGYDALCVFDADNLVHPDFLKKMNEARLSGARVAQGYRDSKNPGDTAISTCYSVCYWMLSRFYNGARETLGLSALVNGSGFMVDLALLKELGGWNTVTMTEDFEFSAQCLLAGHRVHYVGGAVIYDEQPLTFRQSWKQRRRWSTGSVQGMERHAPALLKAGIKQHSWRHIDMAITFLQPAVQFVGLIVGLAASVATVGRLIVLHLFTGPEMLLLGLIALVGAFLACTLVAAVVVYISRGGPVRGTGKGIACFALFLLSWMPIGIISLFKPQKTWDAIAHTRSVSLGDMRAA